MINLLFFLVQTSMCNYQDIQEYELTLSLSNLKFELTKSIGSSEMLFLISINSKPFFYFDNSADHWNVSAQYYDTEDWVLESNTLQITIPGSISGTAYLGAYSTEDPLPSFNIKTSSKSPSVCSSCRNGGTCVDGICKCTESYGGFGCGVFVYALQEDKKTSIDLDPMEWKFFRVETSDLVEITAKSSTSSKFRLFFIEEKNRNELPTMLDSKSERFGEDKEELSLDIDYQSDFRIGIFCYEESNCKGSIEYKIITDENYLWVIIVCVIFGIFLVGVIIALSEIFRKRRKNKVRVIQISKENMDKLFPSWEFERNTEETCSICLDSLNGNKCRELACSHIFHVDCIDEWVTRSVICPICKQDIIAEYFAGCKKEDTEKNNLNTEFKQ